MKNSNQKKAKLAGILIILGMIFGVISIVPSVESVNYLNEVVENKNQILTGAFFQLLLVPTYLAFALILYSFLLKYNKSMAITFVSLRFLSTLFQLIGVILLPFFILLSQVFLATDELFVPFLESCGEFLKRFRDLTNHLGVMLATGTGNLILYYVLYRTQIIPRWLSIYGLVGNLLALLSSFLILFGLIEVVSVYFAILTIPLVIQEIIFSFWLIFKGFDRDQIANIPNSKILKLG